jgi:hypothetical protein
LAGRRVLLAWELGGGYGHLHLMLPLADRLTAAGYQPCLAVQNHVTGLALLNGRTCPLLDVPPKLAGFAAARRIESWADIVLNAGYATPAAAGQAIAGWLALLRSQDIDLVVAEFAPGAMLAARVADIPCIAVGVGWGQPPAVSPLPAIRIWEPPAAESLAAAEALLLGALNPALEALGGRPLESLATLFDPADCCLCSFPELDHYPARGKADYFGAVYQLTEGAAPRWPAGEGSRCFAYLNGMHPVVPALLAGIDAIGFPTVLHLRDCDPSLAASFPANAWLASGPLRLDGVLAERPLVICQGMNLMSAALAAGCPVLALPEHLEQSVLANLLVQQGFGLGVSPQATAAETAATLHRALTEPGFRAAAAQFATRYAGYAPELAVEAVVEECAARLG